MYEQRKTSTNKKKEERQSESIAWFIVLCFGWIFIISIANAIHNGDGFFGFIETFLYLMPAMPVVSPILLIIFNPLWSGGGGSSRSEGYREKKPKDKWFNDDEDDFATGLGTGYLTTTIGKKFIKK